MPARCSGVDDEVDKPALDPGFDLEVTLAITFDHQAAAGGTWLARFVDLLQHRRLSVRRAFGGAVGVACRIAAGHNQGGRKNSKLAHGEAQ